MPGLVMVEGYVVVDELGCFHVDVEQPGDRLLRF